MDPLQATRDIFNLPPTSGLKNVPLPTYGYHTPPLHPPPFHSLLLCFPLSLFEMRIYIDSSETHVNYTHVHMCRLVHAHVHTCALMHANSLTFSLKADMWVHCKIGPRCTPEIPGSRARIHVVLSRVARSPKFRLCSQAFLSDCSGSEPRNGSTFRYRRSSWLIMHNQVGSGRVPAEGALLIKHRPALASPPFFSLTTATGCYNGSFGFVSAMWRFFGLGTKKWYHDVNSSVLVCTEAPIPLLLKYLLL